MTTTNSRFSFQALLNDLYSRKNKFLFGKNAVDAGAMDDFDAKLLFAGEVTVAAGSATAWTVSDAIPRTIIRDEDKVYLVAIKTDYPVLIQRAAEILSDGAAETPDYIDCVASSHDHGRVNGALGHIAFRLPLRFAAFSTALIGSIITLKHFDDATGTYDDVGINITNMVIIDVWLSGGYVYVSAAYNASRLGLDVKTVNDAITVTAWGTDDLVALTIIQNNLSYSDLLIERLQNFDRVVIHNPYDMVVSAQVFVYELETESSYGFGSGWETIEGDIV